MNYTFTDEDVKKVEKFIEIKNKGYYVSGEELTNAYNRILHKHVSVTQCGSCLRQRVTELENALNHFKEKMALESEKNEQMDNIPQEENKTIVEAGNALKSKAKKK
jgi:hypothetical protein